MVGDSNGCEDGAGGNGDNSAQFKEINIPVPWGHLAGKLILFSLLVICNDLYYFISQPKYGDPRTIVQFWPSTDGRTMRELSINSSRCYLQISTLSALTSVVRMHFIV